MARAPKQDINVMKENMTKTEAEKLAEKSTGYTVATAKDSESKK